MPKLTTPTFMQVHRQLLAAVGADSADPDSLPGNTQLHEKTRLMNKKRRVSEVDLVTLSCSCCSISILNSSTPPWKISQSLPPTIQWRGFMRMCTVATMPPFDAHAHRCNESGCCLTDSNCRETLSLFANYTGVSMETVETPLYPPLMSLSCDV